MSKAVLEMDVPVSCHNEKSFCVFCEKIGIGPMERGIMPTARRCTRIHKFVDEFINTRHPDCPLKIVDDGLRWINVFIEVDDLLNGGKIKALHGINCPKCDEHAPTLEYYNYCPSCGIKLLPPEENDG